jgi:hypothetical protein
MVVARAAPDRDAWSETTDCQACAASEIKHTASLLASTIAEHIKVKATPPEPAHEPVPPRPTPVAPASPAPPPGVDVRQATAETSPGWYIPRALSLTALASGIVLIGTGLYLIGINGEGTCDLAASKQLCPRRYKTQTLGIGLQTGGGVAALGGAAGLLFFSPSARFTHVALNITGSSIAVSGEF